MKNKNFLIIIPARSGSKRLKNKNLRSVGGKSLIELKVNACVKIKESRVIVSTNSQKIAKISKKLGAEAPYLRPKKYSTDKSSTLSCVLDLMRFLKREEGYIPEYIGIMPPTNPFLKTETIKKAFELLKKNKKYNSVIGYTHSTDHPFKYILLQNKKIKFNLIKFRGKKYSDFERTQDWPEAFVSSAAIKIVKKNYLMKFIKNYSSVINLKTFDINNSIGVRVSNFENFDINSEFDLKFANILKKTNP